MPREGKFKKPIAFAMKDLYLDASLIACHEGGLRDFTGKKTFNTTFFRQNIGFGITDISIVINPSLQPLVEITFKDLYGNTIFGTQRGYDNEMDTSVFFAWPPPKFIFSFKGYLGRKVTWMLNLKTTNVSYVPSDGSYEIKCSFVPNQWGFFADIPFLYLIAAKKLRMDKYGPPTGKDAGEKTFANDMDSIFSYIRIGKHVEVKTQEITKEFDTLKEQINAIKYNAANAIYGSNIVQYDSEVSGYVNGALITGAVRESDGTASTYESFFIKKHQDLNDESAIRLLMKRSDVINKLNTFILLNIQKTSTIKNDGDATKISGTQVVYNSYSLNQVLKATDEEFAKYTTEKNQVLALLDTNLAAIDKEIQKRTYNSSKTQIAKLTIGQVMNQIARDTAFILGCILEAGFYGLEENRPSRISPEAQKKLIGTSFPLIMGGENGAEEVPALITNGSGDYGVEGCEWQFVKDFIDAISQGVSEDLTEDEIGNGEGDLQTRINNAEILRPNPYKPYYSNIAENVLVRSGIIAYITRSDDPKTPGDYDTVLGDRDSQDEIRTLSKEDMSNLEKGILTQLSFSDVKMLKRFCTFWGSLLNDDGDFCTVNQEETEGYSVIDGVEVRVDLNKFLGRPLEPVKAALLDRKVLVDDYTDVDVSKVSQFAKESNMDLQYYYELFNKAKMDSGHGEAAFLSIRKLFSELFRGQTDKQFAQCNEGGEQPGFINTAYLDIDYNTGDGAYFAYLVKNNGVYYCYPGEKDAQNENKYYFIVFSGDDVAKLKSKQSEGQSDEDDQNSHDPKGISYITTREVGDGADKDTPPRVIHLNEKIKRKRASDYKSMLKHQTSGDGSSSNLSQYYWNRKIQTSDHSTDNDYPANNLAYMVYSHQIDVNTGSPSGISNLVWGPFVASISDNPVKGFPTGNENPSQNQRVAIKVMCTEILRKLDEVETERNLIIGNVASKASEHAAAMYKQMHTIFHQWQSIASTDATNPCGQYGNSNGLAMRIELKYGGYKNHIERDVNKKMVNQFVDNSIDTIFLYDYPLAPVKGERKINVKNSIISIEPIYSPNADTTVLNIIQQICTKNNFIFVPFPGDPLSDDINDIFLPYETTDEHRIMNYFHVIFAPTPETRVNLSTDNSTMTTDYYESTKNEIQTDAILIQFGGTDNQVFKNISVGTDSTKPTCESILNLQRLVDKENSNKAVTMDCSMLPVMEGRSYKASVEMLGNSQVYPLQYFFIDKMPLFGGLYQIMKVSHSMSPNNMSTTIEGIRMRFAPVGGYGGIEPVTLESLEELSGANSESIRVRTSAKFSKYHTEEEQKIAEQESGMALDSPTPMVDPIAAAMNKDKFSPANIKTVFKEKGYVLDIENKVTLVGVRKRGSYISNKFDDFMIMLWSESGKEQTRIYKITTEPGAVKPSKPLSDYNQSGLAMMAEGQYINMYIHGKHQGKYDALKQNSAAYFYRQKWPETGQRYTFKESAKIFASIGANIHRAAVEGESSNVYNWSEGCQVFANAAEFNEFLTLCKAFTKKYNQNAFTYTLVNEMDFENQGDTDGLTLDTKTKKLSSYS